MSGQAVNQLVKQLVNLEALELSGFKGILATELRETEQNPYSTFYEFELGEGPFEGGELRLAKDGEWAFVSLRPPENSDLAEADLDLAPWGEISYLNINPDIPPEGTVAVKYEVEQVLVSFQMMYESRRLRSVALEWGRTE